MLDHGINTRTCIPGKIRTRSLKEVYTHSREELVDSEKWRREKIECDHCGKVLAVGLPTKHLETQCGIFCSLVLNWGLMVNGDPETLVANFPGVHRGVY